MRILLLRSGQGMYGAEAVVLSLASALAAKHEVTVGVFRDARHPAAPVLIERTRARGIHAVEIPTSGRLDPKAPLAVRKLAKALGCDVVHSHDYKSTLLAQAGLIRSGIRHVATLHGDTGESRAVRVYERLLYWVLPTLDGVSTVSEPLLKKVRKLAPRANARFIANGIDVEALLARVTKTRDEVRAALGVPTGVPLIVAIGRLSPEKAHEKLLAALPHCKPAPFVAIAGDGPLAGELAAQVAREKLTDSVALLGVRTDAPDLLAAADLMVLPSLTEGLPMVLLEAMALATPVVASRVGEIATALGAESEQPGGLVVSPGDSAALAIAISQFFALSLSERQALEKNGATRAEKFYSAEKMAQSIEEQLYR